MRRLTLNNIRAYVGQASIEFATDSAKNVTLIHGINGTGKTSLFLALNWALYGDDISYSGHLINETLLREAGPGESVSGSVSIEFEDGYEQYYLARGIVGQMIDGKVVEKQSGVELYRIDQTGRSKTETFPKQFIERLLPPAIRTFFFFDGDKIAEFTKPGREQDLAISRAVSDVLRLELLNRAATHLMQLSSKINKEIASKGSPKLKELQAEIERNAADTDALSKSREQNSRERETNRERKVKVDAEFLEIREVAEKASRRMDVERELASRGAQRDSARGELMKANVSGYALPLSTMLGAAEDFLEEKRKKKQIPGNFKDQLLMDLLEHQACICERELLPGTPAFMQIEKLLNATVPQSVQEMALTLSSDVKRLIKAQGATKALIIRSMEALRNLDLEIDKLHKERETLELSFARDVNERSQELSGRRRDVDADMDKLNHEAWLLEAKIDKARKERDDLARTFRIETEKLESLSELRAEGQLTYNSAMIFEQIRAQLIEDLKTDMSAEATRIFKSFTWKTEFFKEVRIGDDYLIELFDEFGRDMRSVMSAGETQLLSLAFMLSMTSISDIVAPLVIDTPLARLDKSVRSNLLKALPLLTPQLVLLVTDSEMDASLRPVIDSRVGRDYLLTFNEGVSHISSGAFG